MEQDVRSKEYFVCIIDLMGQKSFFSKIKTIPVDEKTRDHIGRVSKGLREIVKYVQNRYARCFIDSDDVGVELFSDSVMLSIRGGSSVDRLRILKWLDVIVKVIYVAFRYRLPVRGGVSFGRAERSSEGMLYGPAVEKAMTIEAETADYPRMVIDHSIATDLMQDEGIGAYLTVDVDSAVVLNYAGKSLMDRPEYSRERQEINGIIQWVQEWYSHFCFPCDLEGDVKPDPKLARRYVMWLEYLSIEKGNWTRERRG